MSATAGPVRTIGQQPGPMGLPHLAVEGQVDEVPVAAAGERVLAQSSLLGEQGPEPGNFRNAHHMATDSKGNLYTAEVNPGSRVQRFIFKGVKP